MCTFWSQYPETVCFVLCGISEGEELPDDLREVFEHEVQIQEQTVLVQRILCGHDRKEHKEDRGVHPRPAPERRGGEQLTLEGLDPFTGKKR